MFEGILDLFLALIPCKPSLIFSTNWLVVANTTKLAGNSDNFFSAIWLDEIRILPLLATRNSQVVKKKSVSFISVEKFMSNFLNFSLNSSLSTYAFLLDQLFSWIISVR